MQRLTNLIRVIMMLASVILISNTLFSQCAPTGTFKKNGEALVRFAEKGKYDKWILKWRRKAKKSRKFEEKYQSNFRCQAKMIFTQLSQEIEQDFVLKNRTSFRTKKMTYWHALLLIDDIDPAFHSVIKEDYKAVYDYLEYLYVVETYSLVSGDLAAQLPSALNNLLKKANGMLKNTEKHKAKEVSQAYITLMDNADKFYGKNAAKNLNPLFIDKYKDMACLYNAALAIDSFSKEYYLAAFPKLKNCSSPLTDSLNTIFKQKLSNEYRQSLNSNTDPLIEATLIRNIDSVLHELSAIPVDLPCPSNIGTNCDFQTHLDQDRRQTVETLKQVATKEYSKKSYAQALSTMDAAINICHRDKATLSRLRNTWHQDALNELDNKRHDHLLAKRWTAAIQVINEIETFDSNYPAINRRLEVYFKEHMDKANSKFIEGTEESLLKSLESVLAALKVARKVECLSCIDTSEAVALRSKTISELETKMDALISTGTIAEALRLVDNIAEHLPNYPKRDKKNCLRAIYFYNQGKQKLVEVSDYVDAYGAYENSLKYRQEVNNCHNCPSLSELKDDIREIVQKIVYQILSKAETPYQNKDYISACELVKEAQSWVRRLKKYEIGTGRHIYPQEFQYILDDACSKARRRLKIVFKQTADNQFDDYTFNKLKKRFESNFRTQLSNDNGLAGFIDIVDFNPDFLLVVDIENVYYSYSQDDVPTIENYCTVGKRFVINPRTGCQSWVSYLSGQVPVSKYYDSAYGKADVSYILKNVHTGVIIDNGSYFVTQNWQNEIWQSDTKSEYLAYCACGRITFLSNKDRQYFKASRHNPSKRILIDPLQSKLKEVIDSLKSSLARKIRT